ncbi:hypothetical protein OEZ86_005518 [Tetradesmus obliquus]|nr:hypothetical protein OEZ86_005518 [Tetradesmus obliquus]
MITKVIYIFMLALLATPASSLYGETSTIDPSAQVDISATNPLHPGLDGGAFFVNGTRSCRQLKRVCTPGLRNLQRVGCKWINVTAPDGAACDVYRCIQGMCWQGVCMGGAPATCPAHKKECMQYKCNWKTGNCSAAVSKPDWSSCKGGYCQAGVCKKQANACSPLLKADKCRNYFLSMTTDQCTSVATQCTQRPPDACKMLRCNNNTGLCTTLVKRPDNTICPGGRCQSGECKTKHPLSTSCPAHTNTCKVLLYDPVNGTCTNEVNKLERTTCPGGTCKTGVCRAAAQCPTECPTHEDVCKAWECNLATGACTVEVIKPDKTSCNASGIINGTCNNGSCISNARDLCANMICQPHKELCKAWVCDADTGSCTIEANKPDKSPCTGWELGGGCCLGGACLAVDPPVSGPCMTHVWNQSICGFTPKPENDGKTCNASGIINGTCNNGSCISNLRPGPCTNTICPPHKELCKAWVCDADTGSCTIEVNKPDRSPCTGMELGGGCCFAGACRAIDPDVSGPCMTNAWDPATCSWRQVDKPDKSPCTGFESGGCCVAGGCLAVDPPVSGPCMTNAWDPATCTWAVAKPVPDGKLCSDGNTCTAGDACKAGTCTGNATAADGTQCTSGGCIGTCNNSKCGQPMMCP